MSIEIKAWKCEKCSNVYLDKDLADNCCKKKATNKCRVCGCDVKSPFVICKECQEIERFHKAKKVNYSDYIGCLWDERMEEYFYNKDDMYERYENDDEKILPEPKWCYGCIEIPFEIDIDSAIERAEEDMYEDFDSNNSLIDLKELYNYIDSWNKKQSAKSYTIDYNTVVLLRK
jgi:hypothetical protein